MLGVYSRLSFGEQVILLGEMPALPWLGVLLPFVLRLLDRRTTWAGRFRSYPCAQVLCPTNIVSIVACHVEMWNRS